MKLQMKKKWKFGLKVADSHSEPGNLQKLGEIFIFLNHFFIIYFSFFYHFPCPWHLKSRKTMKINEKQWKTIKNKEKWITNEIANEKKCKFGLKVADSHSEPGNLQKLEDIFIFLNIFYHFFNQFLFIFLARGTWNPGKPWKLMENHQKQRNMKKKWSCKWKKWKFGLKVADSHSEPGNLQKLGEIFIFFNHFPCPWHLKSRKTMKINEKQWKPGDSIVALFSGKPLVGYTFCHPWTFFEGLRTFWGFQWIWALFWVQTHFTPLDLLNSWRNPRS